MPGLIILSGVLGLIWGKSFRKSPQDYEEMRHQDMLSDDEEIAIARLLDDRT